MGTNAQMGKNHFLKFHGEEVGHLAGVFIDGILWFFWTLVVEGLSTLIGRHSVSSWIKSGQCPNQKV